MSVHVFGYGSLVSPEGLAHTLERRVEAVPAELHGWRRRWSLMRDNHTSEKTFALSDGRLPDHLLGLNVERESEDEAGPVNGALFEVTEAELEELDKREMRYDRVDVTKEVTLRSGEPLPSGTVFTYTAKRPQHFAPTPPADSVIVDAYLAIVEQGFTVLGPGELERYHATTGPCPVEVVEATLVRDHTSPGNPSAW